MIIKVILIVVFVIPIIALSAVGLCMAVAMQDREEAQRNG